MMMPSRKYPSYEEAFEYLYSVGEVRCWGRIGARLEIMLAGIKLPDGREYLLHVYADGLVEIRED